MTSLPRFNLGDTLTLRLNGRTVLATIIPYPNGITIIHNQRLTYARERDFTHHDFRYNIFTADRQLHARRSGQTYYYLVRLSSGESIVLTEVDLLTMMNDEIAHRTARNNRSNRSMHTFLTERPNDNRPYLPNNMHDNIMSYLYETPLSTNINTRIHNRQNPPPPSTLPIDTIARMQASLAVSTEETRINRMNETEEERQENFRKYMARNVINRQRVAERATRREAEEIERREIRQRQRARDIVEWNRARERRTQERERRESEERTATRRRERSSSEEKDNKDQSANKKSKKGGKTRKGGKNKKTKYKYKSCSS